MEPSRDSSELAGASRPEDSRRRAAVVVTGASEGIGLAIAHRFAAGTGQPVLMIARRADMLAAAAQEVAGRNGVETFTLALDVTAPDAADQIAAALDAYRLHADVLVNNAGIGLGGDFLGQTEEDLARLVDLNVRALTLLTRRFLPGMLDRRRGGVINIASLGGYAPGPYQAAYYASKAYVLSLTRALAHETARRGVRVCVVAPGPVPTEFHARMGATSAFYRQLVPAMSAESVARSTWRGWRLGLKVIDPGLFTPMLSLLMRVTPWLVLVPIVGWLLRKRYLGRTS
jgi:short-subunit dehydrogenase